MWTLAYGHHEDRPPTHGYEPTREAAMAAMAAFAKSWRRAPGWLSITMHGTHFKHPQPY
jgi:hypothetical protein